ncbi:hypothetical protein [Psychromonas sp. psych-6C06]|uniref:hypothetical protein n=1 Tax=Psychromonas sp. psych-6C06 TaxID=2058089 RepID=UPI00187CBEB8|nr:hypothetical protein [Psychromonas sp. psych-6C06]
MNVYVMTQYFTVAMVLTITLGLFVLKPVQTTNMMVTADVSEVSNYEQPSFRHELR